MVLVWKQRTGTLVLPVKSKEHQLSNVPWGKKPSRSTAVFHCVLMTKKVCVGRCAENRGWICDGLPPTQRDWWPIWARLGLWMSGGWNKSTMTYNPMSKTRKEGVSSRTRIQFSQELSGIPPERQTKAETAWQGTPQRCTEALPKTLDTPPAHTHTHTPRCIIMYQLNATAANIRGPAGSSLTPLSYLWNCCSENGCIWVASVFAASEEDRCKYQSGEDHCSTLFSSPVYQHRGEESAPHTINKIKPELQEWDCRHVGAALHPPEDTFRNIQWPFLTAMECWSTRIFISKGLYRILR